ncbi:hypothetical protein [Herbiconiux moechotypicola]|uniref:hypothetical protein n=1 Tax=Herbiconiux moechotypicola TaxID=637393 RepID=UPI00217E9E33|nr:hypothetical protein [Herbiconiux moechotypicola]
MEGKLDTVLTQQQDHEKRIRELEARPSASPDHETRLRAVETKSTVSPRGLWTAIVGAGALIVAVLTILEKLTT